MRLYEQIFRLLVFETRNLDGGQRSCLHYRTDLCTSLEFTMIKLKLFRTHLSFFQGYLHNGWELSGEMVHDLGRIFLCKCRTEKFLPNQEFFSSSILGPSFLIDFQQPLRKRRDLFNFFEIFGLHLL